MDGYPVGWMADAILFLFGAVVGIDICDVLLEVPERFIWNKCSPCEAANLGRKTPFQLQRNPS